VLGQQIERAKMVVDDTKEKAARRGGADCDDNWPQWPETVANGEERDGVG